MAKETLDFVLRDMVAPGGGFIASLSAVDDRGVEGGSYLWSRELLERLLDEPERRFAALAWGMQGSPNNPGGYLPVESRTLADVVLESGFELEAEPRFVGGGDRSRREDGGSEKRRSDESFHGVPPERRLL